MKSFAIVCLMLCMAVLATAIDFATAMELLERQEAIMKHVVASNGTRSLNVPAYNEIYPVSYAFYTVFFDLGFSQADIYEWTGSDWENVGEMVMTYESGHVAQLQFLFEDDFLRFTFTWENGHIASSLQEVQIHDVWQEFVRESFSWDGENLASMMRSLYTGEMWMEYEQGSWTYDGTQVQQGVMQTNQGTTWMNSWRSTATWGRENINQVYCEWWDGDAWQPDCRDNYTYNADGNCLTDLYEQYYEGWEIEYRDTYSYDGNLIVQVLTEDEESSVWENDYLTTVTYSGGVPTEMLEQEWDGTQWVNDEKWVMSGNATGDEDIVPVQQLAAWPNPFNPDVTVSYSLAQPGQVSVQVYDIRGRLVNTLYSGAQEAGEHTLQWNGQSSTGTAVGSGVYLLRVNTPQGTRSQKMTLLK